MFSKRVVALLFPSKFTYNSYHIPHLIGSAAATADLEPMYIIKYDDVVTLAFEYNPI